MALLTCKNAAFGYDGETVLTGIDFSLRGGEYLYILGENGAGKSTLVKGILGLINPVSGSIEFGDGLRVSETGYLPQQTQIQQSFPASVFEVVLSGRINSMGMRPFYNRNDREDAILKLELIGMKGYEKKSFQELSGGQKQRVLLARAMCAAKRLILLDEPVSGLDPAATTDLYELVADINKNMGMTVIMVSHDIEAAKMYASHVMHLSHTQLFFGSIDDYTNSKVGRDYLKGVKA